MAGEGADINGGVDGTADDFSSVVKREFNLVSDLVATDANSIVPADITIQDDALAQSWLLDGCNWLNPPYDHLARWAKKCYEEAMKGAKTLFLVPASVGSN